MELCPIPDARKSNERGFKQGPYLMMSAGQLTMAPGAPVLRLECQSVIARKRSHSAFSHDAASLNMPVDQGDIAAVYLPSLIQ